jgi:soluble lytic murein transglycosylase
MILVFAGTSMKWRDRLLISVVSFLAVAAAVASLVFFQAAHAAGKPEKTAAVEKTVAYLKGKNIGIAEDNLKAVVHAVYDQSRQRDLDYRLALAVIEVESNFKKDVVSQKGARGLFQIKPSLAKYIAKDAGVAFDGSECLHEPDKNIKLGVYHLSKLVEDFKDLPIALHAYNAGASKLKGRTAKSGEPRTPFAKRVLKEYEKNLSVLPEAGEPE